ncbi:MAG: HAMP domain-containing protein [Leptospiraceae bacterium]|nr:HAMP domain-containing protein [Leptospiraceae bacterium]MCP5497883.1 HAMP domain-containing protein [Leptospiraceae bacterium]
MTNNKLLNRKIINSKGYSLSIEKLPDDFWKPDVNLEWILTKLQNLKAEKVCGVFVFIALSISSKDFEKKLDNLKLQFREEGIEVFIVDSNLFLKNDFEYILFLNKQVRRYFQKSNCKILFSKDLESEIESILVTLIMNHKGKIAPENLIYKIRGRNGFRLSDRRVYEFKKFLDPMYKIPKFNLKNTKLPDTKSKLKVIESITGELYDSQDKSYNNKTNGFKPSQLTIRVKLLSIVSVIIMVSLSTMITLATFLFKKNSETLIQEYNLSLARLTGLNVESELKNTMQKMQTLSILLRQSKNKAKQENKFINTFFDKNQDILYYAIVTKDSYKIQRHFYNYSLIKENNLKKEKIDSIFKNNMTEIKKTFLGAPAIVNVSQGFELPILSISIPMEEDKDSILLLYMESSGLLKSFQATRQTDIFQLFMLNSVGETIAHTNLKEAIAKTNRSDIPIVKKMIESKVDNGSQKYVYLSNEYLGSYQLLHFGQLGVISTVESKHVFEAVYQIQKQNLIIAIIILTVTFLVIFYFSKTLTVPIVNLLSATLQVQKGNYQVNIIPSSRDEVGVLTHSFISMARGLEEREKIKDTFGKFVNKEIAERALRSELKLGGEKKECAIFFSDLRNFTGMSEKLKPEEVVEYLNEYFTEMVECIYLTNGIVDKFIGDAIMAHWGALYSDGKDTENAIKAALMMRMALIDFNNKSIGTKRPIFRFGCGINTGPVISGQIGSNKKLEYTIIGDAVNLASRIEYLNKQFKTDILISEASYDIVKDIFAVEKMEPIYVRGKEKEQTIYAVLGMKSDPNAPANLEELRELVGIPIAQS